jgi:hypothetical protein
VGDVRTMFNEVHYNLKLATPSCQHQGSHAFIVSPLIVSFVYVCATLYQLLDPLEIASFSAVMEFVDIHLGYL